MKVDSFNEATRINRYINNLNNFKKEVIRLESLIFVNNDDYRVKLKYHSIETISLPLHKENSDKILKATSNLKESILSAINEQIEELNKEFENL